jgi:hypothetical protein
MKVQHDSLRHAAALKMYQPISQESKWKAIQDQGHKSRHNDNLRSFAVNHMNKQV